MMMTGGAMYWSRGRLHRSRIYLLCARGTMDITVGLKLELELER